MRDNMRYVCKGQSYGAGTPSGHRDPAGGECERRVKGIFRLTLCTTKQITWTRATALTKGIISLFSRADNLCPLSRFQDHPAADYIPLLEHGDDPLCDLLEVARGECQNGRSCA